MTRLLKIAAMSIALALSSAAMVDSSAEGAEESTPAEVAPATRPTTQAQWRERVEALTPGMTLKEVAAALGSSPNSRRKTGPGQWRYNIYYYTECSDIRQWLVLRFVDGVYSSAQW